MTSGVVTAEAALEWHWLEARRTDDDKPFLAALHEWEKTTAAAIRAASRGATNR